MSDETETECLVDRAIEPNDAGDDEHAAAVIHRWLEREPGADLVRWYDAA